MPCAVLGLHSLEMNMHREKAAPVTVSCVLNPVPPLQSSGIILKLYPALGLLISQMEISISPS